ncbi:MAG TPA: hypothetical protein PL009_00385 [Flavipsychrobacter sp.]|nr:hypothetical protein [Flavipsychrobacter sp.]
MIGRIANGLLGIVGKEFKYSRIIKKRLANEYHKQVATLEEGNKMIAQRLKGAEPFLVARIGLVELWLVLNYLEYQYRGKITWHEPVKEPIWKLAGIFPVEDYYLKSFAKAYIEAIRATDLMGIWNNDGENEVVRRFCPNADLMPLESIEPYFFNEPWSAFLEGKKVLVVHPFEDSIKHQYLHKRQLLFANQNVLPEFELKTVRSIQTLTYNTASFNNWIEVFEHMKAEIAKQDFDVALIGAGGYGLPLGAYVKSLGKQAIHMGGATQILFGIKGKRWEDREQFQALFNEHWKRPFPEEQPNNAKLHENGAYW